MMGLTLVLTCYYGWFYKNEGKSKGTTRTVIKAYEKNDVINELNEGENILQSTNNKVTWSLSVLG